LESVGFLFIPFGDKKMNWDRGFKRITLILSIVGAVFVWIVCVLMTGIIWPINRWISRGFVEDKQKNKHEN